MARDRGWGGPLRNSVFWVWQGFVPMNTQQLWLPAQIKAVNIPMQVEAELRRTCPWLRSQWQMIALEEEEPVLCRV